ncbi:MAG: OmpA family protein [Bacteroidota bacterium]
MNPRFLLLCVFLQASSCLLLAQGSMKPTWTAGIGLQVRERSGIPVGDASNWTPLYHADARVGRYLSPSFSTEINASFPLRWMNLPSDSWNGAFQLNYHLNNGKILPIQARIAPYIHVGMNVYSSQWPVVAPLLFYTGGIGTHIRISPRWTAYLEGQFQQTEDNPKEISYQKGQLITLHAGFSFTWYKPKEVPFQLADTDQDGIVDLLDTCPDALGPENTQGCPDADGDGVADDMDKCPNIEGLVLYDGCPANDRDGDGVRDAVDLCPQLRGSQATQGCPDRDGDLVADQLDECPGQYGPVKFLGCPDTDEDGIPDKLDMCPTLFGSIVRRGCPGITVELEQSLVQTQQAIKFDVGQAYLTDETMTALDSLVIVLFEYPDVHLRVSGHTDAEGDLRGNQILSIRRAKACVDYLVSSGVASERLIFSGYGAYKPIADNFTSLGSAKNRRIELEAFLP